MGARLSNGRLRLPALDDQEGHIGGQRFALLDEPAEAGDQPVGRIAKMIGDQRGESCVADSQSGGIDGA